MRSRLLLRSDLLLRLLSELLPLLRTLLLSLRLPLLRATLLGLLGELLLPLRLLAVLTLRLLAVLGLALLRLALLHGLLAAVLLLRLLAVLGLLPELGLPLAVLLLRLLAILGLLTVLRAGLLTAEFLRLLPVRLSLHRLLTVRLPLHRLLTVLRLLAVLGLTLTVGLLDHAWRLVDHRRGTVDGLVDDGRRVDAAEAAAITTESATEAATTAAAGKRLRGRQGCKNNRARRFGEDRGHGLGSLFSRGMASGAVSRPRLKSPAAGQGGCYRTSAKKT